MQLTSLDEIKELNCDYVKIKDKKSVLEKINSLIKDGFNNLHVVSDYDMTITKQHENGKPYVSSFAIMQKCSSIPKSYIEKDTILSEKYRPIEVDPTIPFETKSVYMKEWWDLSEAILRGIKLDPKEIEDAAQRADPPIRNGAHAMFRDLSNENVPVLIFSAGLGDSVEAVLKYNKVLYPNVKVISNYLHFDENNVIKGYKEAPITVLSKNEQCLVGTNYYKLIENRHNVLLMGDHLGDAAMVEGVPNANTVLKIGFLYSRIEDNLPLYEDTFDIVLVDDQTMDIPRAILQQIHK